MLVLGAAFRTKQVVPAIDGVEVRSFDQFHIGAAPDGAGCFRLQLHGFDIEFSQGDAVERMMIFTEVPGLLHQILASIGIMEQAGVEAHAIDTDWLAPRAADVLGSDQIVRAILERAIDDFHVGVDKPEFAVRVGQVRRPDAAARRVALHVQLGNAV